MQNVDQRGHWGSKIGFILAAAGSAVGLGNIWRFPYITGENGGAAFVVVYLACVFLIGFPLLINELAIGRASGKDAVGAFRATRPGTPFVITGFLCIACCFLVLTYYGVIAGWTIGYAVASLAKTHIAFEEFAANPVYSIILLGVFILMTVVIVERGIQSGIEKWSKVLMPLLLVMVLAVIVRSVTLPGAWKGIEYYMKPNFSKIHATVVLKALGQAFFSLSVGWGLMITYGSYMEKRQSIVASAFWVVFMDTLVALLGGFMVFPAVFAFGKAPDSGTGLTFITLPSVFEQMPAGALVGFMFFCLLTIAALTSSISMLEVPVSYLVDEYKKPRRIAAWAVGILAFLVGIPSALSSGACKWLTHIKVFGHEGLMDILDFFVGTAVIVLIAFLCSVYVGWVWKPKAAVEEISQGAPGFTKPLIGGITMAHIWVLFVKFICPVVIAIVFLNIFGVSLF
ncbi:MAG: sodium-dependent transporter [Verrucomicrobia bacterium]|nr:sodium-dependent transporter [Verrucomicrobiota bacterium]